MTSNIGAKQLKDFGTGIGYSTQTRQETEDDHVKSVIENALKRTFSPEFLNRIDDVVIFNSLTQAHIHLIIEISLRKVYDRLTALGYNTEVSDKAKDFLAEKGYDPKYGARPLNRAIQKFLEDPMAEAILNFNAKPGDTLCVDLDEKDADKLSISLKQPKKEKTDA